MRILVVAVMMAASTFGAGASSILVIGDGGLVGGASVEVLNDGHVLAAAPSVITLGTPIAAVDPDVEAEGPAPADEPLSIAPLPTVIRAGIEGQAFTRALDLGGAGSTQTGESEEPLASVPAPPKAKKQPATDEPPQAAAQPSPEQPAPRPPVAPKQPAPVHVAPQPAVSSAPAAPMKLPE